MNEEQANDPVGTTPRQRPADNSEMPKSQALTLSPDRLAGSDACLNCGTGLLGPFCYYCGQPDKNFMRFFPVLLRELLEDFLDFDSRFVRTIKPLLFKPGKLTRDYLDGKRFRYVPPLRLYIFSSIAFFFLAAIMASDSIQIGGSEDGEEHSGIVTNIQLDEADKEELNEALEKLGKVNPDLAKEVAEKVEQAGSEAQAEADAEDTTNPFNKPSFDFNGKPWDRETNPLILPFLPDRINDWINDEIERSPQKGKEIEENPDLFKEKFFEMMPATMFVLLPIVALLFKLWYLFAKKYYVEHLIFALHNHSFIFVLILISMLLTALVAWGDPAGEGPLTTALDLTNVAVYSWIPLYLLLSLKRVYRQGWGMTIGKFAVIGFSYLALLTSAGVFAAILSFLLL